MKNKLTYLFIVGTMLVAGKILAVEDFNTFITRIRNLDTTLLSSSQNSSQNPVSSEDLDSAKTYILDYYDGCTPSKTIESAYGDTIDYIPFEQQESVRNLPPGERAKAVKQFYDTPGNNQEQESDLSGCIPVKRVDMDFAQKILSINKIKKQRPPDNTNLQENESSQADTQTTTPVGYTWAHNADKKYESINGNTPVTIQIYNIPSIPTSETGLDLDHSKAAENDPDVWDHTLFQIWRCSNLDSPSDLTTLETGYIYFRAVSYPMIFIYSTNNNYTDNGGNYNNLSGSGFIQTSSSFVFNTDVSGESLALGFCFDPDRGWVYYVNGSEVGYYPSSRYHNPNFSQMQYVSFGTEIYNSKKECNVLMGNGNYDSTGVHGTVYYTNSDGTDTEYTVDSDIIVASDGQASPDSLANYHCIYSDTPDSVITEDIPYLICGGR